MRECLRTRTWCSKTYLCSILEWKVRACHVDKVHLNAHFGANNTAKIAGSKKENSETIIRGMGETAIFHVLPLCSSINIVDAKNMVTTFQQVDHGRCSSASRRKGGAIRCVFSLCHGTLKYTSCRVSRSRVFETDSKRIGIFGRGGHTRFLLNKGCR